MVCLYFDVLTRGLNFDTLPICDCHHYCAVTHLFLSRYFNTEYVKNKSPNKSKHSHSNLEHEEHTQKSEEHNMTCTLSFPICLLSWLTKASPDVCSFLYICIFVYGYSFTLTQFCLLSQKKKKKKIVNPEFLNINPNQKLILEILKIKQKLNP